MVVLGDITAVDQMILWFLAGAKPAEEQHIDSRTDAGERKTLERTHFTYASILWLNET